MEAARAPARIFASSSMVEKAISGERSIRSGRTRAYQASSRARLMSKGSARRSSSPSKSRS
jgi:hypothetical protein